MEASPAAPVTKSTPPPAAKVRILYSEIGIASWYGAPYHNARSANGQIYNENAMTAANRTLPMGTMVRVTNLATHQSAVVKITDRGPFVPNRILDLSRAAAIRTGVYRSGVARVRMDVLGSPHTGTQTARWCVQIGAFRHAGSANKLRDHLQRQFPRANIIAFAGATGHWVRIKPSGESHQAAKEVAASLHLTEGQAYIVRLN
ncbi:MAG TPA: septal ring lytic transglycosylase RlpA family protein [Acidobacteriaceae bacterium]|nr:septal ring lytic transglycosylase RlpA family protein [Acidobacteriaceae bacterium]